MALILVNRAIPFLRYWKEAFAAEGTFNSYADMPPLLDDPDRLST
jgi:hypothetical protein